MSARIVRSQNSGRVNARFWISLPVGEMVKVTLRPGERLELWGGSQHEEGFSAWAETFEHVGDRIESTADEWGRDCDGRHSSSRNFTCHLADLRANLNWYGERVPCWERTYEQFRDFEAEKAGY